MPEAADAPTEGAMSDAALVTVGLPTHNGEAYLAAALESLLAQDHENIEIVVSDNASTDATPLIIASFAKRETRIRAMRSDELLTAAQNFNRVYAAGRGRYFMWAADDDLWDPTYVRSCLAALDGQPTAVMAISGLRFVDGDGAIIEADYERYDNPDLASSSVVERVRRLLRRGGWYEVYGLARREALERTQLFRDTYGPDVLLVLELAMLGPVPKVDEPLFFYRRLADKTERDRVERQGGIKDVDTIIAARLTHLQESMAATIQSSRLSWPLKLRLRAELLWAVYIADTPIGHNARRELSVRVAAARRDRAVSTYARFRAYQSIDAMRRIVPAGRRFVLNPRRQIGRWRRRLIQSLHGRATQ